LILFDIMATLDWGGMDELLFTSESRMLVHIVWANI
jgi:hypothetical protein